jgi:hypothetical protein
MAAKAGPPRLGIWHSSEWLDIAVTSNSFRLALASLRSKSLNGFDMDDLGIRVKAASYHAAL